MEVAEAWAQLVPKKIKPAPSHPAKLTGETGRKPPMPECARPRAQQTPDVWTRLRFPELVGNCAVLCPRTGTPRARSGHKSDHKPRERVPLRRPLLAIPV